MSARIMKFDANVRFLSRLCLVLIVAFLMAEGNPARAETRSVSCDTGGLISTELALFADKHASNVLDVTGTCDDESVRILNFDNLTIRGAGGSVANITLPVTACGDAAAPGLAGVSPVSIVNSHNISLVRLTITGGGGFGGISIGDSAVFARAVTVQQNLEGGIQVIQGGHLVMFALTLAEKNVIQNNCRRGVTVGYGANVTIQSHAEIKNNQGDGLVAEGKLTLEACCDFDGVSPAGQIVVESNGEAGIGAEGGIVELDAHPNGTSQPSEIRIRDNGLWGVVAGPGSVFMDGNIIVEHNGLDPSAGGEGFFAAFPAGVGMGFGSKLVMFNGPQILNNLGAGIRADLQTIVNLGIPAVIPGPHVFPTLTVNGNTEGGVVLTNMSIATLGAGTVVTGNTGSDVSCDSISNLTGVLTGVGITKCANTPKK